MVCVSPKIHTIILCMTCLRGLFLKIWLWIREGWRAMAFETAETNYPHWMTKSNRSAVSLNESLKTL